MSPEAPPAPAAPHPSRRKSRTEEPAHDEGLPQVSDSPVEEPASPGVPEGDSSHAASRGSDGETPADAVEPVHGTSQERCSADPDPDALPAREEVEVAGEVAGPVAAVEAPPTSPPEAAPAGAPPYGTLSYEEAALALRLDAETVAGLVAEFGPMLPNIHGAEGSGGPAVPALALGALARLASWRAEGVDAREMTERLRALLGAQDHVPEASWTRDAAAALEGAVAPSQPLAQQLARLRQLFERSELRRAEDRDRMLTALMRTSQELQSLRSELAAHPRRSRRGWWGRLWG